MQLRAHQILCNNLFCIPKKKYKLYNFINFCNCIQDANIYGKNTIIKVKPMTMYLLAFIKPNVSNYNILYYTLPNMHNQ